MNTFSDTNIEQEEHIPPNICIFCKSSDDTLYKSTVCKCTSVYFCKKCITHNQSYSKNCPQCKTPLNLTIGKPERVLCCRGNDWTQILCESNIDPDTYQRISYTFYISCLIILLIISIGNKNKGVIDKILFGLVFGIFFAYLFPFSNSTFDTSQKIIHFLTPKHENKYYSFMSRYSSIELTKKTITLAFLILYYIPFSTTTATAIYLYKINKTDEFNLDYVLLLTVPHIIIVSMYIKYILSHFVAYIVSSAYRIIDDELVRKANIIHVMTLFAFLSLNCLFGIVLYYPINSHRVDMLCAIGSHIILNFFFFVEVCRFFKYDCGIKNLCIRNEYSRDMFLCKYDNAENEGDIQYEQYYLQGKGSCEICTDFFAWYFGKGFIGRIRIFASYCAIPFIFQVLGFLSYIVFDKGEKMYVVLICMSYSAWILQTLFKNVLYLMYKIIQFMGKKCFKFWTIEKDSDEPPVVSDINIVKV